MSERSDRFCKQFGVELPVIQAPMAGSQLGAMAIAVSNAGGLGSLPCAMLPADAMRCELDAIRAGTRLAYNVNFFCHRQPVPDEVCEARWREALSPYYREFGLDISSIPDGPGRLPFSDEAADVIADYAPAVVSFHFGLPSADLLARVRAGGAKVLSSATTVEEARWLAARGVDAVIAQGVEAGGHRGMFLTDDIATQRATFDLLADILPVVDCPVIAAGGIGTAEDVARAIEAGAAAVQVGTAYLCSPESTAGALHRAALRSESAHDAALTNLFTGRPARGIRNRLMRELGPMSALAPVFPLATRAIAPLRAAAEKTGSGDFSPLWTGSKPQCASDRPAAEITRALAAALA